MSWTFTTAQIESLRQRLKANLKQTARAIEKRHLGSSACASLGLPGANFPAHGLSPGPLEFMLRAGHFRLA